MFILSFKQSDIVVIYEYGHLCHRGQCTVHCTLHTVHCTLYIDLGRDVIAGVNDAGGQFAAGVNGTG
jgi:hypothetical protein